ncbi:hypothetical protein GW17_00034499 [Ensete ventricosum]|uniref:Uncharacterized protein n=1 Tax=Ensete ventricosum TaxID=4639 RepID=A0A444DW96_ENSVE|nr:hypothetical protein GW17_00034499 [Ensete ventricosum]RZR74663.1 hypothetical protein BHM03_00040927 [Ensete ventricosum]
MRHGSLPLNYARLSSLLSLCGRDAKCRLGSSLHAAIIKHADHFSFDGCSNHRDVMVVWNALISMYSKCGLLLDATKVFDQMRYRDSISWNSVISGCLIGNDWERGFWYFRDMRRSAIGRCDHATFTTVLSLYVEMELLLGITMVHALTIRSGFEQAISVGNALISAYLKHKCSNLAQKVFDGMLERNVITWTAMISGLAQSLMCKESLVLFQRMRRVEQANSLTYSSSLLACSGLVALHEGQQIHGLIVKSGFLMDLCVESALMDLYAKCGMMEVALQLFRACKHPDDVCLTLILVGLSQNGFEEKAFKLFAEMVGSGMEMDANMFSAVLGAFGPSAPFSLGKQIHSLVIKKSLGSNVFVSNGLINMYAKCGELQDSSKIFKQMEIKNSVSWNSIIAAFARHGHGSEALRLYEHMKAEGMEPTDVTFLSLLHACGHVGHIEKGMGFLKSMSLDHGIMPRMEHYACVVDMLGRAGLLDDAKRFIEDLPLNPNAHLWQALLGASSIHGNLEMGRYAAEHLLLIAPECSAAYVLLANIYSSDGRWEERARILKMMKEMGVKKDTGSSWIEVEKDVHIFVVEDRVHPQAERIYEVLNELVALIRDQEHVLHKRSQLYDIKI